jgi:hypothetical protein
MIIRIYILTSALLFFSCAASNLPKIQVSERKSATIESVSLLVNQLDFYLESTYKPYRCAVNPGIMKTAADTYYTLNFSSGDQALPFDLKITDSLILKLDDSEICLNTLDVSRIGKKYSAYYRIDYWDLLDIGNADNVEVHVIHGDSLFKAIFSSQNIQNFQHFTAKYILNSEYIPGPEPAFYQQPWGFLSGGAGKLYVFWLATYTNFIKTKTGFGDFIAAGLGYAPFSYTEWAAGSPLEPETLPGISPPGITPIELWVEQNQAQSSSFSLNLMYGFTFPSPFGRWSFESGICFCTFFTSNRWQNGQIQYLDDDILTIINEGIPYRGMAVGGFFQIGGFWFQYNSNKTWTAGISLPVPWW